jgi:hypothetical protein
VRDLQCSFASDFPAIWSCWKAQMEAVARAGLMTIASTCAATEELLLLWKAGAYTPHQTVGDLVVILDSTGVVTASVVGHDFGANVAWSAAIMRPDRFTAVWRERPLSGNNLPSSLMSALDDKDVSGAAQALDAKLIALAENVSGAKALASNKIPTQSNPAG